MLVLLVGTARGQFGLFGNRTPEERFERGVAAFNDSRFAAAQGIFKKLVEDGPVELKPVSMMLLMKAEYHAGNTPQAQKVGRDFLGEYSLTIYAKDVYQCFGDIFVDDGKLEQALAMYLNARRLGTDPGYQVILDERLNHLLPLISDVGHLRGLAATESSIDNQLILHLAEAYAQVLAGKPDEAATTLARIGAAELPENYESVYRTILEATYEPAQVTITAGVILPLTGPEAENARLFLAGLNSAVAELARSGINLSLVVFDNYTDAVETSLAVRNCAAQSNISLIVGPLTPENSVVAAVTAQEMGIPIIIPICTNNNLTEIGDFVFQSNATLVMRGKLAGRYFAGELQLDSLAVLAPADDFGNALVDAFVTEVDVLGKTVVAVEQYSGRPDNLREQFTNLRQVAFALQESDVNEEFLGMEIDSLESMFEITEDIFFEIPEDDEEVMTAKDSARMVLSTIQGIFIPIHGEHIQYLGTQFPSYNLHTQLIGNEAWLDLNILNQDIIGPHLQGMKFVANHYIASDSAALPIEISELADHRFYYFGLDHGLMISNLAGPDNNSRISVKDNLQALSMFRGAAQMFSFTGEESNINAALQILEYRHKTISPVGYFRGDSLYNYDRSLP